MGSYGMELQEAPKPKGNRRLLYFLCFLIVVLPVIVGVLVWHFTKCETEETLDLPPVTDAGRGGNYSTTPLPSTSYPKGEIWENLRLPRYIMPVHYDITLYPDFYNDNGWFYGNETVEIDILNQTSYILIHINYLNVTRTELTNNVSGANIDIKRTFFYEDNQFWVIETTEAISAGTGVILSMTFDGSLTRSIVGFYKSTYTNSITREKRYLASSKFEPVDARRAFPCFDEPNIKAEYTITLVHKPEYIALSNMPNVSTTAWAGGADLVQTKFNRSVKMSTYLVCFIVCDFTYQETEDDYGITVRVYAAPDRLNQTSYALEVANHTISLYTKMFDVPYPLPKLDLIAIPDFVSGAMEHWGLITFREVYLLYDPLEASSSNKQRCALVISHEVAHMWFGNIVTMDWWDDLWLNEGFASFMEYIGVDSVEESWNMMSQFVVDETEPVMVTDAGTSSHPIVVDVTRPSQITEVFDSISYSKGSAVIRMLEVIMGRDQFFDGVKSYLQRYRFDNARTDDLWQELGNITSSLTVKSMMDTWTRQMGLPYINITTSVNAGKTTVTAQQHRYLSESSMDYDVNESPFKYKWYVALDCVMSAGSSDKDYYWMSLNDTQFDLSLDLNADASWVKFNVNGTGYYRVLYPDSMWERFGRLLVTQGPEMLSDADRAGLIDDAFNLARGGYLAYDVALGITEYLDQENQHLPWDSARMGISYIKTMLSGEASGLWIEYILNKTRPVMRRLGWDDANSDHLQRLMRSNLIELTCGFGCKECLGNATTRFRNWMDNGETIPPNLRSLVYKYGMRAAGEPEQWDKMWDMYTKETVPQEKIKLMYGLSQTPIKWLLERFLEYAMDETKIRRQDFFSVITYIGQNPVGHSLIWDWTRENWPKLVKKFDITDRYLGRMMPRIVSNFNSEFKKAQVESFFEQYRNAGAGERGRVQALDSITRNIVWVQKYQDIITDWLKRMKSS